MALERLDTSIEYHYGVIEHLHRYAISKDICSDKIVLDLASGEGYGSNLLSNHAKEVIGVDISAGAIKNAKQKYQKKNLSFLEGSALHIPVQASSIDVIISFETIEHLEEQEEMMKEFKRVLKPNGKLLISSPAKEVYHLRDPENPYHLKELTTAEFRELCSRNFKFCDFYTQKIIIGSLIRSSENSEHNKDVIFYDGDYNNLVQGELIHKDRFFNIPFFNLALCSDDNSDKIASSFFDASKVIRHDLDYYSAQLKNYQSSSLRKLINKLKHLKNILKKAN